MRFRTGNKEDTIDSQETGTKKEADVTEYFESPPPPENPGTGPNFTEKVDPLAKVMCYFSLKY